MGMIGGPRMGSWSVSSKKDPRWNATGRAMGLVCCGGPPEIQEWIEACKKKFGKPPDDLQYGFMKD